MSGDEVVKVNLQCIMSDDDFMAWTTVVYVILQSIMSGDERQQ